MIEAINEELGGNKQYKTDDSEKVQNNENIEEYIRQLEEAGIDFDDVRRLRDWSSFQNEIKTPNQTDYIGLTSPQGGSDSWGNQEDNKEVSSFYQKRPEIYTNINEVLELSKQNGTFNKKANIGKVSDWVVEEAKKNDLDIEGYEHNIDVNAIKHIKKQHGSEQTEKSRGQIAITDEDIKNIPFIIENADYVVFGTKNTRNQDNVIYIKNNDDGTSIFVEEIRVGRKTLTADTIFKRKRNLTTADATSIIKSLSLTPETLSGSIKIIPNPNQKVKLNQSSAQSTSQPKGQINFTNTSKAVITLFETSDKSTFLHETGHYFLRLTEIMAKSGSRLAQSEILEIRKFTGNKGGRFTIEQNELFARSFEAYLRRGIAPNSQLKSVFEKFKEWLMNVYESVSQLNVNMTPEVIDFFDNYITLEVEENVKSNNEKLQKIENVNKKVKELKETLYQNKDITEAEVEEEVMKRLRSDMELLRN